MSLNISKSSIAYVCKDVQNNFQKSLKNLLLNQHVADMLNLKWWYRIRARLDFYLFIV